MRTTPAPRSVSRGTERAPSLESLFAGEICRGRCGAREPHTSEGSPLCAALAERGPNLRQWADPMSGEHGALLLRRFARAAAVAVEWTGSAEGGSHLRLRYCHRQREQLAMGREGVRQGDLETADPDTCVVREIRCFG